MKEMLYEVRCLKSNEDMILALAGQNCRASARIISSFNNSVSSLLHFDGANSCFNDIKSLPPKNRYCKT